MKKILLTVFAVLVVALGITAYAFKDEIKLAYNFLFVTPEKVTAKHEEKKAELKETLVKDYEIEEILADGFTEEEIKKMSKGEMTVEEAMERMFSEMNRGFPIFGDEPSGDSYEENNGEKPSDAGKTSSEKTTKSDNKQTKEPAPKKPDNKTLANQAVANATQELYRLQGNYYSMLGGIESEVISFYNAQIKSGATENRAKAAVISTFSGRLYAMEAQADGQVEAVLSNLTATLNSLGADTSIVSKMRAEYESQKAAKVAQYRGATS